MSLLRTFNENVYVQKLNNFLTALVAATRYPASGSFIPMREFNNGAFLIEMGTLNSATTFDVMQDKGATETAAIKAVTGAQVIASATDDDKWFMIEIAQEHLDIANGFTHITLVPTGPAGGDDYACLTFLGFNPDRAPVTQPTNFVESVVVAG